MINPGRGCGCENQFNVSKFKNLLGTKVFGRHIIYLKETSSTNDVARRRLKNGKKESTLVILAEEQFKGRGRKGNEWVSLSGKGLYFTVVFKLPARAPVQLITIAAGVALAETIQAECGLEPQLKWPNDVCIRRRKVAGILAEAMTTRNFSLNVLLGVGINVNYRDDDFPRELKAHATSLRKETGEEVSRESILATFMKGLEGMVDTLRQGGGATITRKWQEFSLELGEKVVVRFKKSSLTGTCLGIDQEGALLVAGDDGVSRRILVADVIQCRELEN